MECDPSFTSALSESVGLMMEVMSQRTIMTLLDDRGHILGTDEAGTRESRGALTGRILIQPMLGFLGYRYEGPPKSIFELETEHGSGVQMVTVQVNSKPDLEMLKSLMNENGHRIGFATDGIIWRKMFVNRDGDILNTASMDLGPWIRMEVERRVWRMTMTSCDSADADRFLKEFGSRTADKALWSCWSEYSVTPHTVDEPCDEDSSDLWDDSAWDDKQVK